MSTSIKNKARCLRNVPTEKREKLARDIFRVVNRQLNVMNFEEAVSWVAERSNDWFGTRLPFETARALYFRGKWQF